MVTGRQARRPAIHRFAVGDGLLTRFLRDKLAQHVEPTRRGTPRGAPVGFSRTKLAAALFALTSADVKQTARELRVSYGVTRKWRTEAAFQALVARLEDEFVARFGEAVDADLGELDLPRRAPVGEDSPRGPVSGGGLGWLALDGETGASGDRRADQAVDALRTRQAHWVATSLGDAALYGSRVIAKLVPALLDQREGVGRPGRLWVTHQLATLRHQATPGPEWLELGARALLGILRFIVLVLESGLSEDDRHVALLQLRLLQRQLVDGPGLGASRWSGSPEAHAGRRFRARRSPASTGRRSRGSPSLR